MPMLSACTQKLFMYMYNLLQKKDYIVYNTLNMNVMKMQHPNYSNSNKLY